MKAKYTEHFTVFVDAMSANCQSLEASFGNEGHNCVNLSLVELFLNVRTECFLDRNTYDLAEALVFFRLGKHNSDCAN